MRSVVLGALLLLLTGCSMFGGRTSVIQLPDGKEYRVRMQHDAKITYKDQVVQFEINNQGRPTWLEQAVQVPLVSVLNASSGLMLKDLGKDVSKEVKDAAK